MSLWRRGRAALWHPGTLAPWHLIAIALSLLIPSATSPHQASSFAATVASLSEPGGYFDTDNLISNERSYLQVLPGLKHAGTGGAYLGVGPDTNFSYIAELRPSIAIIIDVRRDNLLLHLLFKALFEQSATRAEYLGGLLGRAPPQPSDRWRDASIAKLIEHFDKTLPEKAAVARLRTKIDAAIKRYGIATPQELATIAGFHGRFIEEGLDLRFTSIGRPPQSYYPSYRDLLLETDSGKRQANYLASEEAFQFVKALHARDAVVPVVGDLAGPTAIPAIAKLLLSRRHHVSAFYTSNVEFYLFGQGTYHKFAGNLDLLPRNERSVIIRSIFGRFLIASRPGDGSTSEVQTMQDLLNGYRAGRVRSYRDLIAR